MRLFREPRNDEMRRMQVAAAVTSLIVGVIGVVAGLILVANYQVWGWAIAAPMVVATVAGASLLLNGRRWDR